LAEHALVDADICLIRAEVGIDRERAKPGIGAQANGAVQ
jgi:hypothetical protein